jgi:surface antigen
MKRIAQALALSLTLIMAAACTTGGSTGIGTAGPGEIGLNKTTGGTLAGAGIGGLIGSQFGGGAGKSIMTRVGVAAGGFAGYEVGSALDRADVAVAQKAQMNALQRAPLNQSVAWNNPQNGHSGSYVPVREYNAPSGEYCREYQQTIVVGGQSQNAYGRACRQPDGNWRIQS